MSGDEHRFRFRLQKQAVTPVFITVIVAYLLFTGGGERVNPLAIKLMIDALKYSPPITWCSITRQSAG